MRTRASGSFGWAWACGLALACAACGDDSASASDAGGGNEDAGGGSDASCEVCNLDRAPIPGDDCGTNPAQERSAAVVDCIRTHLEDGTPFHARVELLGIDSFLTVGWNQDGRGILSRYVHDSNVCGGGGPASCGDETCGPRVSVQRCNDPTLSPDIGSDADAGWNEADELITCGSYGESSVLCGPPEQ